MKRTEDRGLSRHGPLVLALLCLVTMLIAPVAQPAFGYTNMWTYPYIDRMLVGGTSTSTATVALPGVIDALPGYCTLAETLHMAAHLQCDTLEVTNGNGIWNPTLWSLDGTVTLIVGVPVGPGTTTIIPVLTAGDSHAIQLAGRFKSFIIYKTGATDSTGATGYVACGMGGPALTYMRMR